MLVFMYKEPSESYFGNIFVNRAGMQAKGSS
jgi:hypothetical protein